MSSCQKNVKYQPDILIVQLQYQMKRLMNPHQTFFLPHFFGKPTNFSYLIFLGNPPIFPTSFFWETHQFFLPHFFGKPTNFSYLIFFGKPINFSYLIFLGNPQFFLPHFFGKPKIFHTSFFWETQRIFFSNIYQM